MEDYDVSWNAESPFGDEDVESSVAGRFDSPRVSAILDQLPDVPTPRPPPSLAARKLTTATPAPPKGKPQAISKKPEAKRARRESPPKQKSVAPSTSAPLLSTPSTSVEISAASVLRARDTPVRQAAKQAAIRVHEGATKPKEKIATSPADEEALEEEATVSSFTDGEESDVSIAALQKEIDKQTRMKKASKKSRKSRTMSTSKASSSSDLEVEVESEAEANLSYNLNCD